MSEILKYKGMIGEDIVELEIPLGLAIGTTEQQTLVKLFGEWLIKRITDDIENR